MAVATPVEQRPCAYLHDVERRAPQVWPVVDQIRRARAKTIGGPDWPAYVFFPLSFGAMLAAPYLQAQGRDPDLLDIARLGAEISCLSAWRMTQGIYRFDSTVLGLLASTPIDGTLPAAALTHLPQWCVYIETPGFEAPVDGSMARLHGVFAWLDRTEGSDHDTLMLSLDIEGVGLSTTLIPLAGTLDDALASTLRSWERARSLDLAEGAPARWESNFRRFVPPLLNLVLFLCSSSAEFRAEGGGARRPSLPVPVRQSNGKWRILPPSKPTLWRVGSRAGARLRAGYQDNELGGAVAGTAANSATPAWRIEAQGRSRRGGRLFWDAPCIAPA